MSELKQDGRPLRTLREQEVQIALQNVVGSKGRIPTRTEVQKEMKRLKFKSLSLNRISELIASLEKKGYVRWSVEICA